mmetsp:Transcript_7568/g.13884  ORF Transcript_7568/g.13884 Transcript_7568/m.13884 type:complete len:91 (-) Transcript_7568:64-336(-)
MSKAISIFSRASCSWKNSVPAIFSFQGSDNFWMRQESTSTMKYLGRLPVVWIRMLLIEVPRFHFAFESQHGAFDKVILVGCGVLTVDAPK